LPAAVEPAPPAAAPPGPAPPRDASGSCVAEDAFADSAPIAEASAAVWMTLEGTPAVLVVADSGHHGDYVALDPASGTVRERGRLPLGGAGDDLEGLAMRGDRLWGLTSAGWLRAWVRRPDKTFELVAGPSPAGPRYGQAGNERAVTCEQKRVNCGRNFEGLCLRREGQVAAGACVGMAASKADGHLYCVVEEADGLRVDPTRRIAVAGGDALSDCSIDGDVLWVTGNVFDLNRVRRVTHWWEPARATLTPFGTVGIGSTEAIAVSGQTLVQLSDLQGAPSLMGKFRCAAPSE
jgi:hypothetical protein